MIRLLQLFGSVFYKWHKKTRVIYCKRKFIERLLLSKTHNLVILKCTKSLLCNVEMINRQKILRYTHNTSSASATGQTVSMLHSLQAPGGVVWHNLDVWTFPCEDLQQPTWPRRVVARGVHGDSGWKQLTAWLRTVAPLVGQRRRHFHQPSRRSLSYVERLEERTQGCSKTCWMPCWMRTW